MTQPLSILDLNLALDKAEKRIQRLEALLKEALEYFTDHAELLDSDGYAPRPNAEMKFASRIEETLGRH